MDTKDALTPADVGIADHHLAVKAARTQQCRVQHVGTVGGGDDDDRFGGIKAIHLDQQLVQGLLTLVIATTEARAAMTADRVDFVDENDAGAVLLGLLEHVANPAGTDADEHFYEVRTRDVEKWHTGFTGHSTAQQGLTRTRGANHQGTLGNLAAQALEFLRIFQEVDDLGQFILGFIDPGHVIKGDAVFVFRQHLSLGLTKAHRASSTALHLAHEENPHPNEQQNRQELDQDTLPSHAAGSLDLDIGGLAFKPFDQIVLIVGGRGGKDLARLILDLDVRSVDFDALHRASIHFTEQLRIADFADIGGLSTAGHKAVKPNERDDDNAPDGKIAQVHIGSNRLGLVRCSPQ